MASNRLMGNGARQQEIDPQFRTVSIIACLLQMIPWIIYSLTLLILKVSNFIYEDTTTLLLGLLVSSGSLVVLLAIGILVTYLKGPSFLSIILLTLANLAFVGTAITFITYMQPIQRGLLLSLVIGIPFLIIAISHFIFSLGCVGNLFHPMLETLIWLISVTAPIIVLFVHKASYPEQPHNLLIEVILIGTGGCLLTSCWISALKHSLSIT